MTVILLGCTLIALADIAPVIRAKEWNALVAVLVVFVPALVLAVLPIAGVEVPSILILIGDVFKALGLSYNPVA